MRLIVSQRALQKLFRSLFHPRQFFLEETFSSQPLHESSTLISYLLDFKTSKRWKFSFENFFPCCSFHQKFSTRFIVSIAVVCAESSHVICSPEQWEIVNFFTARSWQCFSGVGKLFEAHAFLISTKYFPGEFSPKNKYWNSHSLKISPNDDVDDDMRNSDVSTKFTCNLYLDTTWSFKCPLEKGV